MQLIVLYREPKFNFGLKSLLKETLYAHEVLQELIKIYIGQRKPKTFFVNSHVEKPRMLLHRGFHTVVKMLEPQNTPAFFTNFSELRLDSAVSLWSI